MTWAQAVRRGRARAEFIVTWTVVGSVVGLLAGIGSTVFLRSLDWATSSRESNGWLLFLLPLAGAVLGVLLDRFGGDAVQGTNLLLTDAAVNASIERGRSTSTAARSAQVPRTPRRMSPVVLLGSTVTHLFGGSGGREGAAVQIAAGLTETVLRPLRRWWDPIGQQRVLLLTAVFAGAFGSVFGVPAAGIVFGLEVLAIGQIRTAGLIAASAASLIGDRTAHWLGIRHENLPAPTIPDLDAGFTIRLILVGVACGLAARSFVALTDGLKTLLAATVKQRPIRLFIGGLAVVAFTLAIRTRDYNGLGLELIDAALGGSQVVALAFAWKLLATSLTIGSGFPGGEVTPLLCVGACLGSTLASPLGLPKALVAVVAYTVVFGAASNTPLACTVLAAELFGMEVFVPVAIAMVIAWVVSGPSSVYSAQGLAGYFPGSGGSVGGFSDREGSG
jgi:H+/Cl- antiporter ClcA